MTSSTSTAFSWFPKRASFDAIYQTAASSRVSFDEAELLKDSHWDLGEDARLREDIRFRMTPWGRWIAAKLYLANDAIYKKLHHEPQRHPQLDEAIDEFDRIVGRRCVFCTGDPRFVLDHGTLRLAVSELSEHPLIEDNVTDIEKYVTHLPLHSLKAAAASEPAGEWGGAAQEDVIETLGWMRVSLPGRRLNPMMFVARIEGHSMDNGRSGLADGSYTVFELWPAGSRQNMNVLVRGAFTDPESGSYAVKKYVADQRDEEGRHHNVTLVSLNPDKVRYPDIELAVEQDDDVAVVAKVTQALSPVDFARLPKKVRRTGRRDLTSQDLIEDISKSLARHTERFFAHPACDSGDEGELARKRWASEIVCLEPEAGGIHIEVGALDGLWKFVKKLCLVGSQGETYFLASNARHRRQRLGVSPSSGPWKIEPVGFEDDPDVDLSALDLAALDPRFTVAFRVDAEGVGRRVASGKLSPGMEYRLLVPPLVIEQSQFMIEMASLPDGWHIWELAIPLDLPIDLERQLTTLGFRLGCPQPQMTWVLVPAVAWRTTPKGIPYPCFFGQSDPVVAIKGLTLYLDGEALFFIHGPTGTSTTELPVEEELMVQLRNLTPGKYVAALIHRNTSILPARIAFEVIDESPKPPSARWAFTSAEQMHSPENDSAVVVGPQDLRVFDTQDDDSIARKLELPPGWPVQLAWREVSEDYIGSVSATLDGEVDLDWVATLARERWQRRPVGDLVMDFRELGCLILSHDQSPDPDKIKMELERIVSQRGSIANSLTGTSPELQKMWFEPVCRLLGYDMEPISLDNASFPPDNVCLFRLIHTHRFNQTIKRQAARLLAVVESLPTEPSDELSTWIDAVSAKEGLWDIVYSDGLKWAVRRRGSRLALDVLDLKVLLSDHGRYIGFLRTAAEGV